MEAIPQVYEEVNPITKDDIDLVEVANSYLWIMNAYQRKIISEINQFVASYDVRIMTQK